MSEIKILMEEIDRIDGEMITLLIERFSQSRLIGDIKLRNGQPLFDPIRVAEQQGAFVAACTNAGLNANMAKRLITSIVDQVLDERKALANGS